ncbi:hypothetical protein CVT24_013287 [Panaeolus cyanescens]|uniref:Uncharacterized protein n=1 Tax=Panaeolus cyanescens TaxID=181874 RepID=A0A409VW74_9AGAR|nr:hypothetical protein CVT24_013287 [Panaeolus cyanescens]
MDSGSSPQQPFPSSFGMPHSNVAYSPIKPVDTAHYPSASNQTPYLTSPLPSGASPPELYYDLTSPSSTVFSPNRPAAFSAAEQRPTSMGMSYTDPVQKQPTRGNSAVYSMSGSRSKNPFGQAFETPQWIPVVIHIVVCGLAYPVLLGFVYLSDGRTLFLARLLIGLGCSIVGLTLGISLLTLAKGIFEAATWATVIHQSRVSQGGGIRFGDLAAHVADHGSPTSALRLLYDRFRYTGTHRQNRKSYDNRWWSFYILLFLFNCVVAGALAFLLGRLIDIRTETSHQRDVFDEVAIQGVLSDAEIQRATEILPYFEDTSVTWTLSSISSQGVLPPVVSMPWENQTVYFSETSLSQLIPGGAGGVGTFQANDGQNSGQPTGNPGDAFTEGSLLRFPQWGLRTKCARIPDGPTNIIAASANGLAYVFAPRDVLKPLFDALSVPFPDAMNQRYDLSKILAQGDSVTPPNLDTISAAARFANNGVTQTLMSSPLSLGHEGDGFITLETVLIRLNTQYAPNGKFSRQATVGDATIGFDSAVCLQVYQPYVVEIYNSSIGLPNIVKINSRSAGIQPNDRESMVGSPLSDPSVTRGLNSTGLINVYIVTHQNSINSMLKDNGPEGGYRPSPSIVAYTDGVGISGYSEFSVEKYEQARSLADARNALPYFAGTGRLLARRYTDKVVTRSEINNPFMAVALGSVLLLGLISGFFVPRLPFGQPRRGFDLYSWMTAFYAQELTSDKPNGIYKNMDLKDIVKTNSNIRLRYTG